jgi:osmotically-inducible protein OsmY
MNLDLSVNDGGLNSRTPIVFGSCPMSIDAHHRMYRIVQNLVTVRLRHSDRLEAVAIAEQMRMTFVRALAKSGCPKLRGIEVVVLGKSVLLKGRVNSFYLKQLAQESIRSSANGMQIVNRIEVDQ